MQQADRPAKPAPEPTEASQPFWDACARHELRIQRCIQCGTLIHYPKLVCPDDGSDRFDWPLMSGRGTIISFVIAHRAFHPGFTEDVPYILAIIELEEGARLLSNIVGAPPEHVRVDQPVLLDWDDLSGPIPLPKFSLAGGAA